MSSQNKQPGKQNTQSKRNKQPQQPENRPPISRQSPLDAPIDARRPVTQEKPRQEQGSRAEPPQPQRRELSQGEIDFIRKLIKSPIFWGILAVALVLLLIFGPKLMAASREPAAPEASVYATAVPPTRAPTPTPYIFALSEVPPYSGRPYVALRENMPPLMEETDWPQTAFEFYNEMDELGRCQSAYANLGKELMPTEPRESISSVKPSGWKSYMYDFVDGRSLYNRCHLIGFQLAGENANKKNLVTGTRYLNVQGMLPFEDLVADYIKEIGNHVLYRVTPVFVGDELVCRGILMEGMSLEDRGEDILFYVYCYNVQPGVVIDYATGESWAE